MTITSNNFDIYSVVNKASAKDRATIFFDEVLTMSISCKQKFSAGEIEALRDSFKTNEEANLFNILLHRCICINLFISQIENIIAKTQHFETLCRLSNSSTDNSFLINELISGALKEAEKSNCISNKKEAKKIFKNLKDNIQKLCLMSLGDEVVRKLVDSRFNPDNEEKNQDFYDEKFLQFFKDTITAKASIASKFLDHLKGFYAESDTKFDVVDGKIKDLEEEIEKLRDMGVFV